MSSTFWFGVGLALGMLGIYMGAEWWSLLPAVILSLIITIIIEVLRR